MDCEIARQKHALASPQIAGYGRTRADKNELLEGRTFESQASSFMLLDPAEGTSTAIDKAFTLTTAASLSVSTGIAELATDATNSQLVLAVFFDGTFQLGDKTYGQAGNRGVAFVKLKLRQP